MKGFQLDLKQQCTYDKTGPGMHNYGPRNSVGSCARADAPSQLLNMA